MSQIQAQCSPTKSLLSRKKSLQNEKKRIQKDSVTAGLNMTFIQIDETVLKSESVLLVRDKQL